MPEVQPPLPVLPLPEGDTKQDPKVPKVNRLEFDPATVCCGDEVKVKVGTSDFEDGTELGLRILPQTEEKPASASRRKANTSRTMRSALAAQSSPASSVTATSSPRVHRGPVENVRARAAQRRPARGSSGFRSDDGGSRAGGSTGWAVLAQPGMP